MLIAKMEFTFRASETQITTKMRFNFEAEDRYTKEGDWEAADATSKKLSLIYFGDADGWWQMRSSSKDGSFSIGMLEHKDPTGISILWTDMPHYVASMVDVPTLPFSLGREGWGFQSAKPNLHFGWRVVEV
jgi:hypothetical protein